ncbi:hypothetical protein [Actinacidiphila acidipaludis]|uniref:Polymerase nucleotidyl transferase domain-containing protein n=1 Tax=Actinacidiphila acidipaludis TaxID=2873382 RepID=A0ABS7Q6S0_9ACTN|nr:hypothetical protein [Streptomyces acidipaludis]MBY8878840.1 hypothetical protein [Streptomyces acidipaludis]
MRIGPARAAAADWVARHARHEPGFRGAYFSGSTVGMPDDAELAPSSDVDVVVVTARENLPAKPGKFRHDGVLLEVSHLPWAELACAEDVLASYHLAGSFRHAGAVIADPTGHLHALHASVAPRFARRPWVRRRCEDARRRVETRLAALDPAAPFHEQVNAWLFPTGVTCHVLLVAALRNPTVRLRYRAAREVCADYGHLDTYEDLLGLLGCADLSAQRVRRHLRALAVTFDAAAEVARTPFFWRGDITAGARAVAIDGSQALIDSGDHREAVFWIVATFARCHTVLATDAPALHETFEPAFLSAVADLGITSPHDLRTRAAAVTRYLPELWATAEEVLARNLEVTP